jgi:Centromere DNA-binding protein complex CBF3 subunit, domain 2
MHHYEVTCEIHDPPNFSDNSDWFDIKLCTSYQRDYIREELKTPSYSRMTKAIIEELSLPTNHVAHIGRVLGPIQAEYHEMQQADINALGNWNPTMQESRYSSKLPINIIRTMAGHTDNSKIHWNPRTAIEPCEELQLMIFPWLEDAYFDLKIFEVENEKHLVTANAFFDLHIALRMIILQDAAAMIIEDESRSRHSIFEHHVFKSSLFNVSIV